MKGLGHALHKQTIMPTQTKERNRSVPITSEECEVIVLKLYVQNKGFGSLPRPPFATSSGGGRCSRG